MNTNIRDTYTCTPGKWMNVPTTAKTEIENHTTENCALAKWDIRRERLQTADGKAVKGHAIFVGTDDGEPIGRPIADTYSPCTNKEFLDLVQQVIDSTDGARLETCGSFRDRARTFASISIKDASTYGAGGRDFFDCLNFGNSSDGSCALFANNSNECIVCANTFDYNMRADSLRAGDSATLRITHSGDMQAKLSTAHRIVANWLESKQLFAHRFDELAARKVSTATAESFIKGFLSDDKNELSARAANKVNRILSLYLRGRGNSGQTAADLFSGATEYYTHHARNIRWATESADRQKLFESATIGSAAAQKREFWDALIDESAFEKTVQRGELAKLAA